MIDFYKTNGFKLFPCKLDKSPNTLMDWRDEKVRLTYDEAERLMERGHLVGAWIPEDFVIIDIDRNHEGKADGLEVFKQLCTTHDLHDLSKKTMVVKTGSGGFHLYYKAPMKYKKGTLDTSIDVKTNSGYVIACGSPGYTLHNEAPVQDIPDPFHDILIVERVSNNEKIIPKKPLSLKLLQKVLNKVDIKNFRNNDVWLEFIMSIISTAGNDPEVLDIIDDWSKGDEAYDGDTSVRTRIESFSPNGGISPGTFLYVLGRENISPYMRHQVRKEIGAEFNLKSKQLIAHYDLPFTLNIDQLADRIELAKSFFYTVDQASTSRLVEFLVKDKLIYSRGEKEYYYFNGSRWLQWSDPLTLIYNILAIVADECFLRFGEKEGQEGQETLHTILHAIGAVAWRQKIDMALRGSELISKRSFPWDSPAIMETLTFEDGVIDFTSKKLVQRQGLPEEYRRSFIDLPVKEVMEAEKPVSFRELLKGIFQNKDTRKTATQALSLSISGTGKYRKFQIWNGHGNNGKSKLIMLMEELIGDRAITYDPDILLQKTRSGDDPNQVTPGVARFQGTLLAMGSETEETKKISQGIVKNMTGNEKITANPKYKDEITFQTTFQLILATNYLPSFSAYDDAFINRLLVIPFHTSFYESEAQQKEYIKKKRRYVVEAKDPNVIQKEVMEERAAVIKYLVQTYISFETVFVSQECKEFLKTYINDNNDLGKFMDTYCVLEDNGFVSTKYLVEFYNRENQTHITVQWMGRRLKQLHPELHDGRKRVDGTMQRGFYGMILNMEGNEEDSF